MIASLAGRTALVTGASSGLGAHFARILALAGANVVVGGRRLERVQGLAAELEASGNPALAVGMDVTDERSIQAAYDAGESRFGVIDTIIANAGVSAPGRSTDVEAGDLKTLMETNFTGVYLTVREGARRLIAAGSRESGHGRAIILGSITAHMLGEGDAAYAASKAAVAHMGRTFAREWVRQGVNVNVIQPGYIQTEISGDLFQQELGLKKIAGFSRRRLQPIESLDPLLLYLASNASFAMTGAVIDIDDGQSL